MLKEYVADLKRREKEGWRNQLDTIRKAIDLSAQRAQEILEIELAPIEKAKQDYGSYLSKLIQRGLYPLNEKVVDEEVYKGLERQQREKKLTPEEVAEVSDPILRKAKEAYQQRLRQRYEEEFRRALAAAYPLSDAARNQLKNCQQEWGLSDAVVEQVEQPLLAPKIAEYQEKLQRYEQEFRRAIEAGYPLEEGVRDELTTLHRSLGLEAKDVADIERPILEANEAAYQEQIRQQEHENNLQRYEEEFRRIVEAGYPLSNAVRNQLKNRQQELELRDEEVTEIANPILAVAEVAYQEKLQRYEQEFRNAVEATYPLLESVRDQLKERQQELGLRDEEVAEIANPILASAEEKHQQKLQRYEQEFRTKIEAQYPIDSIVRDGLKQLQQSLKLSNADVAGIEEPIVAPKEAEYQHRLEEEQLRREAERQRELERQQELEGQQQERLKQEARREYQAKLEQYEQEFRKAIATEYPIGSSVRAKLNNLKQSLELKNENVAQIEKWLSAPKEEAYQQRLAEEQCRREAAERQRELERRREEAKKKPPLKGFEFQVPMINIGSQTIEKPGFFGKKTETITTLNVTYQRGQAEYFTEELDNGVTIEMVAIAGGTFKMGATESSNEQPQHRVTVQPFLMGKYVVTQAQWKAVAGLPEVNQDLEPDPSRFKGNNRPVEQVSWYDAVEFCDRLSQKTGRQYRLPSEAEWEYACRAGTTTPFYCGETITTDLANYDGNYIYGSGTKGVYRQQTTDVGSFPPNAFGLYDMHGNVWEWCADHWHGNYEGAPIDGSAWLTDAENARRLRRGSSWLNSPWGCRSAVRDYCIPVDRLRSLGFRVVCGLA